MACETSRVCHSTWPLSASNARRYDPFPALKSRPPAVANGRVFDIVPPKLQVFWDHRRRLASPVPRWRGAHPARPGIRLGNTWRARSQSAAVGSSPFDPQGTGCCTRYDRHRFARYRVRVKNDHGGRSTGTSAVPQIADDFGAPRKFCCLARTIPGPLRKGRRYRHSPLAPVATGGSCCARARGGRRRRSASRG